VVSGFTGPFVALYRRCSSHRTAARRTIRQEVFVRATRLLILVLVSMLAACSDNPLPTDARMLPGARRLRLKARLQVASSPNAKPIQAEQIVVYPASPQ
jgi:hypothetical protein